MSKNVAEKGNLFSSSIPEEEVISKNELPELFKKSLALFILELSFL
jgi:hypothetical protein